MGKIERKLSAKGKRKSKYLYDEERNNELCISGGTFGERRVAVVFM
jgi:hypothetical protein